MKNKRIILLITVICLGISLFILIPTLSRLRHRTSLATIEVWDGNIASKYKSGSGSINDPYIISNGVELAYFSSQSFFIDYTDVYFELSNHIVLNNGVFDSDMKYLLDDEIYDIEIYTNDYYLGEEKIGSVNFFPSIENFNGHFNGNSYVVYGLYTYGPESGLFVNLNGNIENLYVENSLVYGNIVGGISNNIIGSKLENVLYSGYVISYETEYFEDLNIAGQIFSVNGELNDYIELPNFSCFGKDIVSTSISGEYELVDVVDLVIKINDEIVTGNEFNVDLSSKLKSDVSLYIDSSDIGFIKFKNLKYKVVYNYSISSGIAAIAENSIMKNVVNKASVVGSNISSGLVGVVNESLNVESSYNVGSINNSKMSSGLISVINDVFNVEMVKVYNDGVLIGDKTAGLINVVNNSSVVIDKSFNTKSYNINEIIDSDVDIISSYYLEESIKVGSSTGNFVKTSYEDLYNQVFMLNLEYYEYFEGLSSNVWVYSDGNLPIVYFDDLNDEILSINIGIYKWSNYSSILDEIKIKSSINFVLKNDEILNKVKHKYYYISETPLSKLDLLFIEDWEEYTGLVKIEEDGDYIIYAKVVDINDNVSFVNSDILKLDTTNNNTGIIINSNKWDNYKFSISTIFFNSPLNISLEMGNDIVSSQYYVSSKVLRVKDLRKLTKWEQYNEEFVINEIGEYIVYVKLVDSDNKIDYINSDRIVYDGYKLSYLSSSNNVSSNSSVIYNFSYNTNLNKTLSHSLRFSDELSIGTKIRLFDNITNKIYMFIVNEPLSYIALSEFQELGKIDSYFVESEYSNEDFTVMLEFFDSDTLVEFNVELECSNGDYFRNTLVNDIFLNIYENSDSTLSLFTDYNSDILYNSNSINNIDLLSLINYKSVNSIEVMDTQYDNMEMNLLIEFVDKDGNVIEKENFKNLGFKLNDVLYYPREDNKVYINIKNSNVILSVVTNETNVFLDEGTYYLNIYNYVSDDKYIVNNLNLNKVSIPVIVDKKNVYSYSFDVVFDNRILYKEDNNKVLFKVLQNGNFKNPSIKLSLYEKASLTAYDQTYDLVDLNLYVIDNLVEYNDKVYNLIDKPKVYEEPSFLYDLFELELDLSKFNNNGYKFVFDLFESNKKIGSIEKSFIIK